ncbi:helix-turn-helix domain-containing protein [Vagococcus sp. CY52-2]|uniref:helix-turn-helix domain-containing protein n=1 Tax=Vagococcus sp. CY52-2 TaxID=2925838 RepID=UPI001F5767C1|nr:helix-turn-helix transcriptional regulator [Vagococcus sp. CY52-2]UNM90564.1 helix-turn-helix domain-containing protein [Vagococcus sp. CY52-2]UNM90617.1 helix-turn-helix domain-containing protein [Vagococcus sp. CY52-2]
MKDTLGDKIKSIRLLNGLSLEGFGMLFTPVADKSNVSRWEKNKAVPTPDRLKTIADLGNVTVDYLMGIDEEKDDMISIPVAEYERLKEAEEKLNSIKEILGGEV